MIGNKGKENKPHIGFFGRCNVGKSSIINSFIGQEVSIISPEAGTTTDTVKKTMEISGIGPVILIDTAGLDDETLLGKKRVEKTMEVFKLIDLCVIIICNNKFSTYEEEIINQCNRFKIPYIFVYNKQDIEPIDNELERELKTKYLVDIIITQANKERKESGIEKLNNSIKKNLPKNSYQDKGILDGIIKPNSVVLLVTPIDSSAPSGRMILPQVQLIRDVLDHDSINIVVKETQLKEALKICPKPDLVITDSQAFEFVSKIVSEDIPLTSFSIVLARLKGEFDEYLKGTKEIENLRDGDRILMLESCSHQSSCEDIGRVKLPAWIRKYTGKKLEFDAVAGLNKIERPIKDYAMVIQCGGCMVTSKQLSSRLTPAIEQGVPVSNYGICIAYLNGIFHRAIKIFTSNINAV